MRWLSLILFFYSGLASAHARNNNCQYFIPGFDFLGKICHANSVFEGRSERQIIAPKTGSGSGDGGSTGVGPGGNPGDGGGDDGPGKSGDSHGHGNNGNGKK